MRSCLRAQTVVEWCSAAHVPLVAPAGNRLLALRHLQLPTPLVKEHLTAQHCHPVSHHEHSYQPEDSACTRERKLGWTRRPREFEGAFTPGPCANDRRDDD
eukprot:4809364-Prymnesium_polylepis.3